MSLTLDRPRVPVEYIGLARDLIRRVDRQDDKVRAVLCVCSLPLIGRKRRRQTLRSENLAEAARHWRMEMPVFGRLGEQRLGLGPKHLHLEQIRLVAASKQRQEWNRSEDGLSLSRVVIRADDHHIDTRISVLVNVSMHALGRRYERGGARTDDTVMADLQALTTAYPDTIRRPLDSEFKISAGSGFWIGTTEMVRNQGGYRIPIMSTRTFVER
jgi:hypothetical protein